MTDDKDTNTAHYFTFKQPELSEWKCYLFGSSPSNPSLVFTPEKGTEPNWFWRWTQYLVFGNKLVKK